MGVRFCVPRGGGGGTRGGGRSYNMSETESIVAVYIYNYIILHASLMQQSRQIQKIYKNSSSLKCLQRYSFKAMENALRYIHNEATIIKCHVSIRSPTRASICRMSSNVHVGI